MGGVAFASVFEADAFTVQDLVGDNGVDAVDRAYWSRADALSEELYFDYKSDTPPGASHQIRLEPVTLATGAVRNDRVKLVGFTGFNGVQRDFILLLADDNNNPVTDGTRLIMENDDYENRSKTANNQLGDYILTAGYRTSGMMLEYAMYTFGGNNPYWVGEISVNSEGEIVIDFDDPVAFLSARSFTSKSFTGTTINTNAHRIIDHYHIEIIRPNAYVSGNVYPSTATNLAALKFGAGKAHEPFPAKVTMDGNGRFSIVNLTGDGYAMYQTGDQMRHAFYGLQGGYDLTTGEAWLDGGQEARILNWSWGSYAHRTNVRFGKVANVNTSTGKFDFNDVKGSAQAKEGMHHNAPHTYWVTNGGTCRTFSEGMSLTFPTFAYVFYNFIESSSTEQMQSSEAYGGTTIAVDGADITLNTDMTLDLVGINDTHIRVEATLDALENTDHVDAYELWMVPGKHADGAVNSTPFNHENGHENAVLLQRVSASEPAMATYASGAPATYKFNRLIAKADLAPANTHPDDVYSFFVKAHYNPATNLAPTFHNLVSDPLVVTGIDGVDFEAAAITAGAGVIRVAGTDAPAAVYTVSGAKVYEGTDRTISVAAGIYIVKAGDTTAKVVVR